MPKLCATMHYYMVYITLGGVTGPLLTKYYILVHFACQKAGFGPLLHSVLISLHGNNFKIPKLCATMDYYMVYITLGGVTGPLLTKYYILVHFAGLKAGFWALTT